MKKLKLTRERQERFLKALAETGIVRTAAEIAGASRTRVYELRKQDTAFAAAWEEAEEQAADALEAEAWRRAAAVRRYRPLPVRKHFGGIPSQRRCSAPAGEWLIVRQNRGLREPA